jgi:hypothetical protein
MVARKYSEPVHIEIIPTLNRLLLGSGLGSSLYVDGLEVPSSECKVRTLPLNSNNDSCYIFRSTEISLCDVVNEDTHSRHLPTSTIHGTSLAKLFSLVVILAKLIQLQAVKR